MKHFRFTLLAVAIFASHMILANNSHKHELRATWLATVQNIDWPKTKVTNDATRKQQQKELTDILDKLTAGNMHACFMQVRSLCDAMYQSSYEPWSIALTGTRGKDPGYDPLAFAIEEAHKRGLELHIWVNPFRVTTSDTLDSNDQLQQHAGEWIIKYDNGSFKGQIIDPGYPQARAYVIKVLMEIINNYDVDGIVMDDYFYPYGGTTTEDAASKSLYKPNNVVDVNQDGDTDDDWRRNNVDVCLKQLYDTIQAVKPWVRFGMGTFGIWSTQQKAAEAYGITLPSGIRGLDDYDVQACNPVEWVKHGYVDYINPQLYWSTNVAAQDYKVLCKWWAKDVCQHFSNQLPDGKKVHFFISQAAYHAYDGYAGYDAGVGEIQKQIDVNRANLSSGYTGSVFYNTTAYNKMYLELRDSHFAHKALPPAMDWKVKEQLAAPTNLVLTNNQLSWQHPTAQRFTVYAYPQGIDFASAQKDPTYLQKVVYGKSCELDIDNLDQMAVAVCAYDRFGVEHGVATLNESEFPESDPNATEITWILNGGKVLGGDVPSNTDLWETFKPYYNSYYGLNRADQTIENVATFANAQMQDIMTNSKSEYKWLGDYILSVAGALDGESAWRWHVHAFFNCNDGTVQGNQLVATADFSQAGKPEAWGDAYREAYGISAKLPSSVDATYTLPTPVKDGDEFVGWYEDPKGEGAKITSIPAGYKGTIYAIWKNSNPDSDEAIYTITWVLNGGKVLGGKVPNNEELWIEFMDGFNAYYTGYSNESGTFKTRTSRPITEVLEFTWTNIGALGLDFMTDSKSPWKWLGDYILSVAAAQGIALTTDSEWRQQFYAFFNCTNVSKKADGTVVGSTIDFSQAGKPEAWGDAYRMAYGLTGDLPTKVTETFVLPIPVKDGYVFVGWFDNPEGTGTAITSIPAGWYGTLYAIWKTNGTTDIDNLPTQTNNVQKIMQDGQIFILRDGKIYNIMGQMQD